MLATNHIYRELEPDVFTNNRISSMMDTLKPTKDLFAESVPWSKINYHILMQLLAPSINMMEHQVSPLSPDIS